MDPAATSKCFTRGHASRHTLPWIGSETVGDRNLKKRFLQ